MARSSAPSSVPLHTELGLGDTGWIAADLGLECSRAGGAVAFASPAERTLARNAPVAGGAGPPLLALSVSVLDEEDERRIRRVEERMRRQLVRFNEPHS